MTQLATMDLEAAAKTAAGNWQDFDCFVWFRQRELEKPEDWSIIYVSNRDSGLLSQSNAAVIERNLKPFTDGEDRDVVSESHSHWAVGHLDGFSVRVYRGGQITDAFRLLHGLLCQIDDYPILDESDYSQREFDATIENLDNAAWRLKREFDLPADWQSDVYSWLSDNMPNALENRDDEGGWPDEDDLVTAFTALGFERVGA